MCTVSVIPLSREQNGLRIVFSRDERRLRPSGEPPVERMIAGRRVLMPRDPAAGGTWIAVSDAGIALMLLNRNDEAASRRLAIVDHDRRSRGQIIPSLVHLDSVDAIVQQALQIRAADFEPFRLIVASVGGCIELASDGAAVRCAGAVLPGRIAMFTSSGLGDQLVEAPRRRLFDGMLGDGQHDSDVQDAFHRHQWADRPHLSVWMTRADARTVSRTTIEMGADMLVMRYAGLDEHGSETDRTVHVLALDTDEFSDSELVQGAWA